ncbi:BatA domain-containing protein [Lutibacter sp.]|uniref:BatA domain-containing protein n=1 Tax=Lutibacter sp. TaxID=1925666 RepID=UPI002735695B|nr:BatA domain-containing protein [Lutibacter sp.]MDP3313541.1 BatA domain-containing protein [Lutibacter sp.]
MHFKHPEILYALFLLIIPILVHLFQLQQFTKVPFTNVKILRQIQQQNRKSAKLKKWLILMSRIATLLFLIVAFAQPYYSNVTKILDQNIIVYLDNSFSMQAKGKKGELLKSAAQDLIETFKNTNSKITFITNNETFENIDFPVLKNELSSIKYSPNELPISTLLLKIKSIITDTINTSNKIILISDFQKNKFDEKQHFTNVNTSYSFINLAPTQPFNIGIDSAFIVSENGSEITLKVVLKSNQKLNKKVAVTFHNNNLLIGKGSAIFSNSDVENVTFNFPTSTNFKGKLSIDDEGLNFDNSLFFTISKPEKIKVLTLGENSLFLQKMFKNDEFNYSYSSIEKSNYSTILEQHVVILNEIDNMPNSITTSIIEYIKNGGTVVLIPSTHINITSYSQLLSILKIGNLTRNEVGRKINTINFNHPIFNGVFEKEIQNFQFPTTKIHYLISQSNLSPILKFDSNAIFIGSKNIDKGTLYWIASPLNDLNSDFTHSPLVVPVFYNFAKNSLKTNNLYHTIAQENNIEISIQLNKDEVLTVANSISEFIPLQQILHQKVLLKVSHQDLEQGFYEMKKDKKAIKTIAFNYNRNESDLVYTNMDSLFSNKKNVKISTSINETFSTLKEQKEINWLFKWFLAFSALFLLIEILILKYFK